MSRFSLLYLMKRPAHVFRIGGDHISNLENWVEFLFGTRIESNHSENSSNVQSRGRAIPRRPLHPLHTGSTTNGWL